jgi:hypothetical protein
MARYLAPLFVALGCIGSASTALAAEAHGAAEHPRFMLALFLGATRADARNEPTLGFEAGYRIDGNWSVGAVVERADRETDSTLLLAGVGWHPSGSAWRVQLGVGRKDPRQKQETVVRTGLAYEFEFASGWVLKPYLAQDFIEEEEDETVFGLYFGRAF